VRSTRVALALVLCLTLAVSCSPAEPPEPPPPDWLWVSVWGKGQILAFDEEQQANGATGADASLVIDLGAGRSPYGFDFDRHGNLWVGTQEGEVLGYAAADLGLPGVLEPMKVLDADAFHVAGLRFAPDGWLWATAQGKVMGWSPASLAAPGSPAPTVTFTSDHPRMAPYPKDLAFDEAGNMWLVGDDAVLRFDRDRISQGGTLQPSVVLFGGEDVLDAPFGLAFDPDGDLWVASSGGGVVEELAREDLAQTGAPVPTVVLDVPGFQPLRVAFDSEDGMWVSSLFGYEFEPGFAARIAPEDRTTSGPVEASAELSGLGSLDAGGAIVFHPPPR